MKRNNRRRFFLVGALLLLLGNSFFLYKNRMPKIAKLNPRYPAAQLSPALLDRVKGFTVLISDEGLGGVYRGTGLVLDENTILSCAHLVEPGSDMLIYTYPIAEVRHAKVKFLDQSHDLALFTVDRPIHLKHFAEFRIGTKDGTPITLVGNILGSMQWFTSYGIISGTYNEFLLTDALSRGGNSGGPWVNNKGEVVGITDWGLESHGQDLGITGGISSDTIYTFLMASLNPLNQMQALINELSK